MLQKYQTGMYILKLRGFFSNILSAHMLQEGMVLTSGESRTPR